MSLTKEIAEEIKEKLEGYTELKQIELLTEALKEADLTAITRFKQAITLEDNIAFVKGLLNEEGFLPADVIANLMYHRLDPRIGNTGAINPLSADVMINAINKDIQQIVSPLLEYLQLDKFPTTAQLERRDEIARDLVRVAFGEEILEETPPQIAKIWKDVTDYLVDAMQSVGIPIEYRKDWGMSVNIDARLLKSKEEFIKDILGAVDESKLQSLSKRATPGDIVSEIYDQIKTGGLTSGRLSNIAKRFIVHRVIPFNSADDLIFINEKYGGRSLISQMIGTLNQRAKAIGYAKRFGPDVLDGYDEITKYIVNNYKIKNVERWKNRTLGLRDSIENDLGTKERYFFNTVSKVATIFRHVKASALLGKATISSLTDLTNSIVTANIGGYGGFAVLKRSLAMLAKGKGYRDELNKAIFISDFVKEGMLHNSRLSSILDGIPIGQGTQLAEFLSNTAMVLGGMSKWTDSLKMAHAIEILHSILKKPSRKMIDTIGRYGIDVADLERIRDFHLTLKNGENSLDLIDMQSLRKAEPDLALKVASLIDGQNQSAVVGGSKELSAWLNRSISNPVVRELAKSVTMFQSWLAEFILKTFPYMWNNSDSRLKTLASYMASVVLLQTLVLWAKDILGGKTPRQINKDTALDILLQSGGLSIFGIGYDVTMNNQYGRRPSIGGYIDSTPLVGDITKLTDITKNILTLQGKEASWKTLKLLESSTPFHTLPFVDYLSKYYFYDKIGGIVNPKKQKQTERNRKKYDKTLGRENLIGD